MVGLNSKRSIVFGGVFASVSARICPNDVFNGSNMYDNLVVAAAVDVSMAVTWTDTPRTQAALAAALFGVNGLTAFTFPKANTFLSDQLDSVSSACSICAYGFYKDAFNALIGQRLYATNTNALAMTTCGITQNLNGAKTINYGGTSVSSTYAWVDANGIGASDASTVQTFACVSKIQSAIDSFNECTGDNYDVRTGANNMQCSTEDLLKLDARFGIYEVLMGVGLGTASEFPAGFEDAYSVLPCRSCFAPFVAAVTRERSNLIGGGKPCNLDMYSTTGGGCLAVDGIVWTEAYGPFEVCAGTNYRINVAQTHHATADEALMWGEVLNTYEATVTCGAATNKSPVSHLDAWKQCMLDLSPLWSFGSLDPTSSVLKCFVLLGGKAALVNDCDQDIYQTTNPSCIYDLSVSGSGYDIVSPSLNTFWEFNKCAGYNVTLVSTVCNATTIAAILPIHTSYVPLMNVAMTSATPKETAKRVLGVDEVYSETSELVAAIGDLPCGSCYTRFAAELNSVMTDDDKESCSNPYSDTCFSSWNVTAALDRFETCSGFQLNNKSPNECTVAEWELIENAYLPWTAIQLVASPEGSHSLLGAHFDLEVLFGDLVKSNTTYDGFRCVVCFQDLLDDFAALDERVKTECGTDLGSRECLQDTDAMFDQFATCAGFSFNSSHATTTTTTTLVPTNTGSITESRPENDMETTKGVEMVVLLPALIMGLMAVAIFGG